LAERRWLTPVIYCNYSVGSWFEANADKNFRETLSQKKPFTKIGLVEWLKVKALSSGPNTAKKKKKERKRKEKKIQVLKGPDGGNLVSPSEGAWPSWMGVVRVGGWAGPRAGDEPVIGPEEVLVAVGCSLWEQR
jgi:hypothetical protein